MSNKVIINRLSKYKNALQRLQALGFIKVFSDNLADAIGVTPSQVRKDFSIFGVKGNRKGGYLVEDLLLQLRSILGKDKVHKAVVAGVGNIGTALVNYRGFVKECIEIVAAFDIDPLKQNRQAKLPILPLTEMKDFIISHNIKIGIIAVPDIAAQQIWDIMSSAGIKGVLNFAPIRLRAPENVVVNNVNLASELESIIYFVNVAEKSGENLEEDAQ
ncbi:MAG: redox-sensing transcriptional repressor Rex [Candidatus Omnitrophota bacterium]